MAAENPWSLFGRMSVRRRALTWMTLGLTVIGLTAAAIAYAIDISDADRLLDEELRLIAFYSGPNLSVRSTRAQVYGENRDVLIQVRDAAGALVYTSDPALVIPAPPAPGFGDARVGGERWRSYIEASGASTVQVSQRASPRQRLARTAALEASLPILVTIPLGWLLIGWGLGQMLNSLARLAGAIAARGVESRTAIDLVGVPDEFSTLVEAMNALIGRWRLSLDQQKQFLSDAAHELRTPLTALRLQIDLLKADRAELDAALPELARGAGRASALVDQLLRMARYESGDRPGEEREIDMAALVVECMADFVTLAESKEIDLGLVCSEPARLGGVERDVHLLVSNLIENAVRYTPPGGVVDVGVRIDGDRVIVEVADTGCGIPEELLPRVFDRFFRAPGLVPEGTGLGLAICRAIARRHGLALTLRNRASGGLVATVSGPAVARSTVPA
ncbi:sensor histidine kinase [Lichenibacterium dinghuense]|uniref:sensor histidine kinase n=1 Tax=Lichenibacterium dinghuense TaxID=2895977 RepID=UPI001F3AF2CA|nr:ATP-binding protein [Lichenibacterium sp. 6Y81]